MLHVPLANLVRRQRGRLNNLAVLLVANVFTAGVGFVTTVTIANTLGAARFGELAYALAIGGILAVNVRFGMDRSLIRDLAHYPERFNETLAASLLARGLLLVFSLGGLVVLAALPIAGLELSWGMLLVIAATALNPLQIANVFDIWEVQGRHALYGCLERGLYFALVWAVVLAAPERLGLAWIGLAALATTLLYLFVQYRYAWNRLKPTLRAIPAGRLARTGAKAPAAGGFPTMSRRGRREIRTRSTSYRYHYPLGLRELRRHLVGRRSRRAGPGLDNANAADAPRRAHRRRYFTGQRDSGSARYEVETVIKLLEDF
jgi:hypothetical protein